MGVISLVACKSAELTQNCGPRHRVADVFQSENQNGALFLLAHLELQEQLSGGDRYLAWLIEGSPLKGHLVDISLRDGRDTSRLLTTIPVSSDTTMLILASGGTLTPNGNVPFALFFDVLSSANGVLVIHTNTASSTIQFPLSTVLADTLDACS
jgi:hypothetical protein